MTDFLKTLSEHRCFGGVQSFHEHASREIGLPMRFSVYLPPQAEAGPVPAVLYLAGLTCNEETFMVKAGAQRVAAQLGLALIAPARWDRWRFPAQRSDGTDPAPDAIPQGARLRLDPSVDVSALGLTPLGEAIARAAQKYGFIVVDTAAAVAVMAESGLPDKTRTGRDPWSAILGDVPTYEQLRGFPWARMQVLSAPDKSP